MKRLLPVLLFLLISINCFSQQSFPARIIGKIPLNENTGTYNIQVGAFSNTANTENVLSTLKRNALNPVIETYMNLTRVMIKGIPANQVANFLAILEKAGFNEVIIREESYVRTAASRNGISEKWEFDTSKSKYISFEFNNDMNYLVVENNTEKTTFFGEYIIPQPNVISMNNFGVVEIRKNDATGVDIALSTQAEPDKKIVLSASKAESISISPELDLFCRTWRVVSYSGSESSVGKYLFISKAGTYFFTSQDGNADTLSQWRWYGNDKKEFEYSHNNWRSYGRAQITELTINSLRVTDPGFRVYVPGYSSADYNDLWVLVPVN